MCVSLKPNIQSYVIMNWKILNQPLGMTGSIGIPEKKMVAWFVPQIAAFAGSALSSVLGGLFGGGAAREAMAKQEEERNRLAAERLRKTNENYLDTAAGQNMLRVAREEADKIWKRESGAAKVAGGTDAAAAIAKEQGNKMVGDTMSNIAAQNTAHKDNIDASYRADIARADQGIIQNKMAKSDAIAKVAGDASDALMKLGQSWFGNGSPGGTNVNPAPVQSYVKSLPQVRYVGDSPLFNPNQFWAIR